MEVVLEFERPIVELHKRIKQLKDLERNDGEWVPASRVNLDDVDDYNGWSQSPPEYKDGTPIPGATGWTREVTVKYADPLTLAAVGNWPDTSLKIITVIVTAPDSTQVELVALRSRYGAVEQKPPVDTSFVTWVGVGLEVRDATAPPVQGVNLLNHVVGSP